MSKLKPITVTIFKKVVADLVKGKTKHGAATKLDQGEWCGTACCVAGHAFCEANPRYRFVFHPHTEAPVINGIDVCESKDAFLELILGRFGEVAFKQLKDLFYDSEAEPGDFQWFVKQYLVGEKRTVRDVKVEKKRRK